MKRRDWLYLGVAHTLADDAQSRLVIDIGGGSTEMHFRRPALRTAGDGELSAGWAASSYGRAYFAGGRISRGTYRVGYRAGAGGDRAFATASTPNIGWNARSSGTLQAIETIPPTRSSGRKVASGAPALATLEKRLLKFKQMESIEAG
ncbi:MAG: hypothetical protein IPG64_21125 [Haliea sp.]|nr:hypothetical protein [Haliea sp.]